MYRQLNKAGTRLFHISSRRYVNPLIPIDPSDMVSSIEEDKKNNDEQVIKKAKGRIRNIQETKKSKDKDHNNNKKNKNNSGWREVVSILKKCAETGLITFASLGVLVLGGVMYHKIYKQNVLWKMEESFKAEETLMLARHKDNTEIMDAHLWAERPHQKILDKIVTGKVKGKYYLLLGEKGTGKSSTVMESISRCGGEDCAIVDCSSDVELMRLRIGSALNFEFFEDYIGSLFSMKGPRESTPMLDIERAFMKLEKILYNRRGKTKKPLILVLNNSHLIDSSLVELLQQKAENFSCSGMLTMIFISEDYWLFEKMKTLATRMQVINFEDTKMNEASKILKGSRLKYLHKEVSDEECNKIYHLIGGRPQHLNHVASQKDMFKAAHEIIDNEKLWFLNNCALLGVDMDDDVLEQGKFSISAMLLMKELVEMDKRRKYTKDSTQGTNADLIEVSNLPHLPLWRARQVMTRPDYIEEYDKLNIFTIGKDCQVRADSVPMMRAFHEIASHPAFDELLSESIDRISEIESLERTREIVLKDLVNGGEYQIKGDIIRFQDNSDGNNLTARILEQYNDLHEGERKKWWKRRLDSYNSNSNSSNSKDH